MNLDYLCVYSKLDNWAPLWNSAINPTQPTFYAMQRNADGSLGLTVQGPAVASGTGAGAMLKGIVSALPALPFNYLTTFLSVTVDNSPARQWVEIDTRLTTPADGLTYPGDLDIGVDGTVRVGDINGAWHATAVKIPPLAAFAAARISVLKFYNWTKKTATIVNIIVNEQVFPIGMEFAAAKLGWTDAIVNQLQIDQAAVGGTCSACWSEIGMEAYA